jgi:hypothetical protein
MPTLVLITGYARSGKDTFADGIAAGARRSDVGFFKFASGLKEGGNKYLEWVGQYSSSEFDFFHEEFKVKWRDVLVALGSMSRDLNPDVFAKMLTNDANDFLGDNLVENSLKDTLVIVSDWRYLNEYKVCVNELVGWRVVTVRVDTSTVLPANEEEGLSIAAINRQMTTDYQYYFHPNSAAAVLDEGKHLARTLGI